MVETSLVKLQPLLLMQMFFNYYLQRLSAIKIGTQGRCQGWTMDETCEIFSLSQADKYDAELHTHLWTLQKHMQCKVKSLGYLYLWLPKLEKMKRIRNCIMPYNAYKLNVTVNISQYKLGTQKLIRL